MSSRTQLTKQVRYSLLSFRRNPAATFFTAVLPLIFLVLFTSIFGNDTIASTGSAGGIRAATFYVPGILGLSVVSATMVNLAITSVSKRENGILKRVRGTPLRPWVYVSAEISAALVITSVMTVLVVGIGWVLFDVSLFAAGVVNLLITLVLGAGSFCALGLAMSSIIPNEKAAPAVTNMIVLPLYFVSDVFIITDDETPRVITLIGDVFPVKHMGQALGESFDPFISGTPMAWGHWAVLALWGAFGVAAAISRFRWMPRD